MEGNSTFHSYGVSVDIKDSSRKLANSKQNTCCRVEEDSHIYSHRLRQKSLFVNELVAKISHLAAYSVRRISLRIIWAEGCLDAMMMMTVTFIMIFYYNLWHLYENALPLDCMKHLCNGKKDYLQQQAPTRDDSRSANEEIFIVLRYVNVHYRVHNRSGVRKKFLH